MGKKNRRSAAVPPPSGPAATADGADAGLWTVERVARDLGVAVDLVAELLEARCDPASDFTTVRGVAVVTEAGLPKIRALVEAQMSAQAPEARPAQPKAREPEGEDLTITRVWPWSRNVTAERENGTEVTVVVKSVAHLQAGMVLPGCVKGEMSWFYYGRLPRVIGERQLFFPPAGSRRVSSK